MNIYLRNEDNGGAVKLTIKEGCFSNADFERDIVLMALFSTLGRIPDYELLRTGNSVMVFLRNSDVDTMIANAGKVEIENGTKTFSKAIKQLKINRMPVAA